MESRRLDEGVKPGHCAHEYNGVMVNDSALAFIRLLRILKDETLTSTERSEVACRVLLPNGGTIEQLKTACADAFGISFGSEKSQQAFSWFQDAGRIRASLRQQYGIVWDDIASTTPMRDVYDLLAGLMESGETSFQRAVYYRTARMPKGADWASWIECVNHFSLQDESDPYGDRFMKEVFKNG